MTDELTPGPFFRWPDEATGMAALAAAGLLTEDGEPITASHQHALDIVGTITRGGSYDPETGEVLEPPTTLPGWHVNYLGEVPDGWEEFAVHPVNPTRVYAAAAPAPAPTTPPPAERIGQEWTDSAGRVSGAAKAGPTRKRKAQSSHAGATTTSASVNDCYS